MPFVDSILLGSCGLLLVCACSAAGDDSGFEPSSSGSGASGSGASGSTGGELNIGGMGTGGGAGGDCSEEAKRIYLVSVEHGLYSFDPNVPGLGAYNLVGTLSCPSASDPQSMAVDRGGTAWVFYSDGQLFQVSTLDASCAPTSYQHPVQQPFNQLGMGFTATVPDSTDEVLYVISPNFGLSTIDIGTMAVSQTNTLVMAAELTGGIDAKLFMFAADTAGLSEIDLTSLSQAPIHTFSELSGTTAWAFARYAGLFYMFTSPGTPTTTTIYDPTTDSSMVRDASIGFTVVGAGQSTCVPPPPPE